MIEINSYCFSEPTAHLLMKIVICYHHEKFYLSHSENLQRYCSDPWKQHSKQIKKYLQVIDIETAQKIEFKTWSKTLKACYKHVANNGNLNIEDIPENLDASFYDMLERNE